MHFESRDVTEYTSLATGFAICRNLAPIWKFHVAKNSSRSSCVLELCVFIRSSNTPSKYVNVGRDGSYRGWRDSEQIPDLYRTTTWNPEMFAPLREFQSPRHACIRFAQQAFFGTKYILVRSGTVVYNAGLQFLAGTNGAPTGPCCG